MGARPLIGAVPPGILPLLTRIEPVMHTDYPVYVPGTPVLERCLRKWESLKPVLQGERHDKLLVMAGWLRGEGVDVDAIERVLLELNQECRPPWPERDVGRLARSVAGYSPRYWNE
jgi:Primase C terminal 1 (PriCT-1)